MRRALHIFGLLARLALDVNHGVGERIEHLAAFGFGGLDQQAFGHDERKVGRRRVKAMIEQPLGKIHRVDVKLARLALQGNDEFVARAALRIGRLEARLLQAREQIVGVQGCVVADLAHAGAPEHAHVDVGTQQHSRIAHERRQPPDRLRQVSFVNQR